jgi:hypothetical protein
MPKVQPVGEEFFATAPVQVSDTFEIPRPAAEVWDAISNDRALHWCRALNVRWTSPRPFQVGTTRKAKILGGVITVDEQYYVWEEGRRQAFCVVGSNLPMFKHLAEDYIVEPNGPAACTFTWKAALEPTTLGKVGGPVNSLLFKTIFADTRKHFGAK